MGLEQLKQQLADGKITREQFVAEVKKLLDAGSITQAQHDEALKDDKQGDPPPNNFDINTLLNNPDFQKFIQSENDKIRTKYTKEKKDLEGELERIKTEKMTAEQKAQYEADKLKSDLEAQKLELTKREVALHTVDQLKDKQLPLEFRDILAGSSVDETNTRIATFETAWNKAINDAVDARFKENGGDPGKGKDGNGDKNPWKKEHFNLTEQGRIYATDPAKAKKLAAEAGITLNY